MLACATSRKPPKWVNKLRRRLSPTPLISSSDDAVRALPRLARCPVIAKRWASSRICWIKCSAGSSLRNCFAVAVREDQLFQSGFAFLAFGYADQGQVIQAQLVHDFHRDMQLPQAAVDQNQVRPGGFRL